MNTGEGVGILLRPKTLVEGQREGVSPRHGIREKLRGWGWRGTFYSAGLWVQPCRVPQLETCPCILIGSRGSGRCCEEREAKFLLAAATARVNCRLAGGVTAGEEAFDNAGGEGEPSAGAAG